MSFEMKSNLNDKAIDAFLDSQTKEGTFKTYKTQMKQYLKFSGKTGQELIEIKRNDKDFQVEKSLFAYRKHLLGQGKRENYAVGSLMAIRSFYAFHRVPLQFRKQESRRLAEKSRKTSDYLFSREDLAQMALAGNLKERYVLLVGKSIGLRASDFVALTYGTFRSLKLDGEAPIALGEITTLKEKVKAYPYLDSDAIPLIKAMLEANRDKPDSQRVLTDTEDNLTRILQTLCKKAGFEVDEHGTIHGRRIRFHALRKYLIEDFVIQYCQGLTKRYFTFKTERISAKKKGKREYLNDIKTKDFTSKLNNFFETYIEVPRIKVGERQTIETLINEEALLFAKYLRNEKEKWNPRIAIS